MILDPGFNLTLRPMKYPQFYEMYKQAIKNTWTVEEVDLNSDIPDLQKVTPAERHLINRLIAFFATGDSIVSNNLVLNLYKHINSPEARMYLSRQLYEEALHVQFYLTLLDTYIPEHEERNKAFAAIENIPSIKKKGEFCFKWIDSINHLETIQTFEDRKQFLQNLICFASCVEGLFFYAAFAYVYFLRSKSLFGGLSSGTNWVFRDECVVPGTEVLTVNGWVEIQNLTDEKVAQFDMETEEISFAQPTRYIKNFVDDELLEFSHEKGGIHKIVTKKHDLVQKWDYQGSYSKQKAVEFKPNGKKKLAVSGYKKTGRDHLTDFERLNIAFQADGFQSDRYDGSSVGAVPIEFSFKKERKISRMTSLLNKLGFDYKISFSESKQQKIFTISLPLDYQVDKNFNWVNLEGVSANWCQEFVEELSHWDGHVPSSETTNPGNYIYYSSAVESNVDVVQAISAMGGMHCTKTKQDDHRSENYATMHRAYIHNKTTAGASTLTKKSVPYKGEVYCITVPSGCFVMRYKGKVCITGNSCHMNFAFNVADTVKQEEPKLWDKNFEDRIKTMIAEAIDAEMMFAQDVLNLGVAGLSIKDMHSYLQYCADQRFEALGISPVYKASNPFSFMELQDVQELTNFFERRVSQYQVGVEGEVDLDSDF